MLPTAAISEKQWIYDNNVDADNGNFLMIVGTAEVVKRHEGNEWHHIVMSEPECDRTKADPRLLPIWIESPFRNPLKNSKKNSKKFEKTYWHLKNYVI